MANELVKASSGVPVTGKAMLPVLVERAGGAACQSESTGVRPGPDQRVNRCENASSISLRRRATNSAAGSARASGAPCPAHWAP